MTRLNIKTTNILLLTLFLLTGCASITTSEKDNKRSELDLMAKTAIDGMVEQDAELQKQIDDSLGYFVANMKVTKVPIVGAGGGEGVLVNKETNKRLYVTVKRLDIGGGWGARSYKILLLIETQEMLDKLYNGTWEFQSGVEASAGTAAAEGSTGALTEGFTVHILADGGASATATVRVIRIKVNSELTND